MDKHLHTVLEVAEPLDTTLDADGEVGLEHAPDDGRYWANEKVRRGLTIALLFDQVPCGS